MKKIKKPILKKEDSLDYKISEYVSNLCQIIVWNYVVKVSWFRKDFLVSSILPKNEGKLVDLRYCRPNIFVRFLEEFRIPTSPFEINWTSLHYQLNIPHYGLYDL